ncbi:MAG: hypothetical protein WCG80_09995 [Spirochaetales bacterium]
MSFRFTVPGNLLLAGEYALLEQGGLGAAVAVEPRLTVTVTPQEDWELVGRWPGTVERWTPEAPATFAGTLFLAATDLLTRRGDERERRWSRALPCARIELDSSAFFDGQGRKRGFGSSAAIAVGLAVALARLQEREDPLSIHQVAVAAHRVAQGGSGSGYDVTASYFGGFGLFTGGETPRWSPLDPEVLPWMAVFAGPKVVKTTRSIDLYRAWQASDRAAAGEFVERSNAAVLSLSQTRATTSLFEAWSVCRELGLALGDAIGSSARLEVPAELPPESAGVFYKALGAGNETGLAASVHGPFEPLPAGLEELRLSPLGVVWE